MRMDIKIAYFPMARGTFFMPSAEENFAQSRNMLQEMFAELSSPEKLLMTPEEVAEYAAGLEQPELIIYQCSTFVGSEFLTELTRKFSCPIVIWTVREPSIDGGRLKLNSLTGAFSAANSALLQGRQFDFVFGNPTEDELQNKLRSLGRGLQMAKDLKNLAVGSIGSQPPGFGFGAVDENELAGVLGTRIVKLEAAAMMETAAGFSPDEIASAMAEMKERVAGWDEVPAENQEKYARLRTAYQRFIAEGGIGAVASRCWPDFFVGFGAPVCGVLSMLNDNGVPSSCEADIPGAITMYIGAGLSGNATYFGDPVAIDESCDAIVYWHCGAGASCLASKESGAKLGVHPNRKIGPTMEFGLQSGPVTVLRLGRDAKGYRMFLLKGEALDEPQKFFGTSVTVRPQGGKASERISEFVQDGWEPHFVVAYGDISAEVKALCKFSGIPVWEY